MIFIRCRKCHRDFEVRENTVSTFRCPCGQQFIRYYDGKEEQYIIDEDR